MALLRLTWLEVKIFMREPLGAIGSILVPVGFYVGLGRALSPRIPASPAMAHFVRTGVPIFAALTIAISAVLSLVTIVSIYREGGILKRLRATPLRPMTILTAHVLVKLLLTAATLILMMLAGRRYFPVDVRIPMAGFTVALLISTVSILSIGFVVASLVTTARFAQPAAAVVFYPMLGLSGLFFPVGALPPALRALARLAPLTYVVSLLGGILNGDPWSAHVRDIAALALVFAGCTAVSARLFRWE